MTVVDRHGLSGFPLDRHQAGFHEQVKPAISILQLQRGVVFVPDHAGEPSTIPRNGGRRLLLASSRPENSFTNLAGLMIPCEPREVIGDELSLAVTCGAAGLAEEKIPAPVWIARRGFAGGLALQETDISNERPIILFAQVGEAWHSSLRNPFVNQVDQCLIRDRPHSQSAYDVWRVLTP